MKDFEDNIDSYLADSTYFDEFYKKAENEIAEHLQETTGGIVPLEDEVKDYAYELWSEYTDDQMPIY